MKVPVTASITIQHPVIMRSRRKSPGNVQCCFLKNISP